MNKTKTTKTTTATTAAKAAPKAKKEKLAVLSAGVGRRKSAVARIFLKRGNGKLIINGKEHTSYFDTDVTKMAATQTHKVYPHLASYDVLANVSGGGLSAQADAIKLAIARAIIVNNPEAKSILKEHNLLTVDSRLKERKKYGQKAARRKFQFVKR